MKIFALFNSENELVKVALTKHSITAYWNTNLPHDLWNALFLETTPDEKEALLKEAGYQIKSGIFVGKNSLKEKPCQDT